MGKKRKATTNHYVARAAAAKTELPELPPINVSAFNLTSDIAVVSNNHPSKAPSPAPFRVPDEADEASDEWQLPGRNKKPKKEKQTKDRNYPEICLSPQRLRQPVLLIDIQRLVLWLSADASSPQWVLVRHKPQIRRVVVLFVPGLTLDMFDGSLNLNPESSEDENQAPASDPKDYFPTNLNRLKLPPCVQAMAEMFPCVWPVKAAGDDRQKRLHSPIKSFLTSPLPKSADPTTIPGSGKRLKVTELLLSLDELVENEYPLHSSQMLVRRKINGFDDLDEEEQTQLKIRDVEGWVETDLSKGNGMENNEAGSILDGKTVYTLDCEMCRTAKDLELTRISMINWDGEVVYDMLVKPPNPITDYLTPYSGITEKMMVDVETTISDVQTHLLTLFNDDTILVGQSLNSDLTAMKLAHPHIIDTSCIYEHPRGRPYKCSLKWLTQRFLKRDIQSSSKVDESGELVGHDSIEDALACLDLLKLKIDKGEGFGKADDNRESIFKRLGRPPHCRRTAIVDHGDPGKYYGAHATSAIACTDDQQVVAGVLRCANGDSTGLDKGPDTGPIPAMDFVWGRFCALEQIRSFQKGENGTGMFDINGPIPTIEKDPPRPELITAVKETVDNIAALHSGLPKCTALVVYSGTGDPRRLRTLHALQKRWKEEYKAKRWSEISVKWTDLEESEMKKGLDEARQGIAFLTVK